MMFTCVLCVLLAFLGVVARADIHCQAVSPTVTDDWCNENCNLSPPNCPSGFCRCDSPPTPPAPPVPTPPYGGKTWAVLAAGSNTYWNYRHQADICHAYQILRRNGIPAERIITLIYDDVANSSQNPFPGQLFNEPNGPDVYAGCKVDYRADSLSPSLFLSVLKGDAEAVQGLLGGRGAGSSKVLQSGPDDDVFVYFADHGGSGMIMFPGGAISASDLLETLKEMHGKRMYRELVFYLDTCESGSMFTSLPSDLGILAVSSARPDENANAIWCYEPDTDIQGKNIGACLGDAMSVGWMMDSDAHFDETLDAQFIKVKDWSLTSRCSPIPCFNMPCMYGDTSIGNEKIGRFQGQPGATRAVLQARREHSLPPSQGVDARDVKLVILQSQAEAASRVNDVDARTRALDELRAEQAYRRQVDDFFSGLATMVCADGSCEARALLSRTVSPKVGYQACHPEKSIDLACHKTLLDIVSSPECLISWDDYSAKYARLLADFCDTPKSTETLAEQIRASCVSDALVA